MSSTLLSYDEAASQVRATAEAILHSGPPSIERIKIERVRLDQAAGRVLARPLLADLDQPPFARSTRDGFACRAAEASRHMPLALAGASRAGDPPAGPLPPGAAWEIMTGAPVPEGADAVIMVEHVEAERGHVRLPPPRTVAAGENFVPRGAQGAVGDELLQPGSVLSAAQIALAASCGYVELDVFIRPRVAILTTGDEIVPVEAAPAPGQIRNSNGPMLAALVAAAGGQPWLLPPAADTAAALDAAIAQAVGSGAPNDRSSSLGWKSADLFLITGGVSAGKFDLVEPALLRAGATFHFTGIRIQPGKPTVFGELPRFGAGAVQDENGKKCCCFGLPGNPVSSAATFLLFAAPVLAVLSGRRDLGPRFALARLESKVRHQTGLTRFLPAACTFGADGGAPRVTPVPWQGSGDLTAFARSNCFLVLPENQEHFEAGAEVRILLP